MAGLIKRGQVWTANLNPGYGVEIHKVRPILIVSKDLFNQSLRTVIVVPLSSQVAPLGPEKVLISKGDSGLKKDSAALVPFIRFIDKKRLIQQIGKVSSDKLIEIEESLKLVLGMTELG